MHPATDLNDRRLTPASERVALESLRGQLERSAYTQGEPARVAIPLADLCRAPEGARDRQLNFGADVTVIETVDGWSFVQAAWDGYCGWVRDGALSRDTTPITHYVIAPATHIYPHPDFKTHQIHALSICARLSVEGIEGRFARLATGGYVPAQHIAEAPAEDPVEVAKSLLGTPYLWGGNSDWGIDCSGLVQTSLAACNVPYPGDSDQQQKVGEPVESPYRAGDLLFWPGHIAMAINESDMIHATANVMAVTIENIESAITRIEAAGDGPFLGARRIALKG